jgi:hypothetical protein
MGRGVFTQVLVPKEVLADRIFKIQHQAPSNSHSGLQEPIRPKNSRSEE